MKIKMAGTILGMLIICSLIIGIPLYNAQNKSGLEEFISKHDTGMSVAVFKNYNVHSNMHVFQFHVQEKLYEVNERYYSSLVPGDAYEIIYDKKNLESYFMDYTKPVYDIEKFSEEIGIITGISKDKQLVYVDFEYHVKTYKNKIEGTPKVRKFSRIQFFPKEDYEYLKQLKEKKQEVKVLVYNNDVRRAYIILEK